MKRHWQYFKYVLHHKWNVLMECLKLDVPIWIALLHDWDKFLPDEWLPYARTYYSPDGTPWHKDSIEFMLAWMRHQHRNKHHWQYWLEVDGTPLRHTKVLVMASGIAQELISNSLSGENEKYEIKEVEDSRITTNSMPDIFRREMLADWRGSVSAQGMMDVGQWYHSNKNKMKLHSDTRKWIENQLQYNPEVYHFDDNIYRIENG